MKKTDTTEKKEIPGRFKKGTSGNPAGRPVGARNKEVLAALALLKGEAQALTRTCIDKALDGDSTALKLCFERLIPAAKDFPIDISLPKVNSTDDLPAFTGSLLDAVSSGDIPASEAEKISKIAAIHQQSIQLSEFDKRLATIEQLIKERIK